MSTTKPMTKPALKPKDLAPKKTEQVKGGRRPIE
jgi:hypothetical protein